MIKSQLPEALDQMRQPLDQVPSKAVRTVVDRVVGVKVKGTQTLEVAAFCSSI